MAGVYDSLGREYESKFPTPRMTVSPQGSYRERVAGGRSKIYKGHADNFQRWHMLTLQGIKDPAMRQRLSDPNEFKRMAKAYMRTGNRIDFNQPLQVGAVEAPTMTPGYGLVPGQRGRISKTLR